MTMVVDSEEYLIQILAEKVIMHIDGRGVRPKEAEEAEV